MSSKIWIWEFFLQILMWNLSFPSSKDFKFLEKSPFLTSLYQALNESERKRRVGKLIKSNWKILPPLQRHPLPLFAACPFFHSSPFTESLAEANGLLTSDNVTSGTTASFQIWCLVVFKSSNWFKIKLILNLVLLAQVRWSRSQSPCRK